MQLRGDLRWTDLHGYLWQRGSDTTTLWLRKAFRALLNSRTFFAVFFFSMNTILEEVNNTEFPDMLRNFLKP